MKEKNNTYAFQSKNTRQIYIYHTYRHKYIDNAYLGKCIHTYMYITNITFNLTCTAGAAGMYERRMS